MPILVSLSAGAHLAFAVAFNTPVRLGAVVSLSGFYSNPHRLHAVEEVRRAVNREMPVWLGHGTGDSVIKYVGAISSRAHGCVF